MKLTILGSCRQYSLYGKYHVTSIQESLSYPHYTKEILEVIKYCKYQHISENDTLNVFRTPILNKLQVNYEHIKNEFNTTDLFVIEIASKIKYMYNNIYVHHIACENEYNLSIKEHIQIEKQCREEIENDIISIKNELDKPFIIVSHLVTRNHGDRYLLSIWLEEICLKYNIPFVNPIKELMKSNVDLNKIFLEESILAHYNDMGHEEILKIYTDFINKIC